MVEQPANSIAEGSSPTCYLGFSIIRFFQCEPGLRTCTNLILSFLAIQFLSNFLAIQFFSNFLAIGSNGFILLAKK